MMTGGMGDLAMMDSATIGTEEGTGREGRMRLRSDRGRACRGHQRGREATVIGLEMRTDHGVIGIARGTETEIGRGKDGDRGHGVRDEIGMIVESEMLTAIGHGGDPDQGLPDGIATTTETGGSETTRGNVKGTTTNATNADEWILVDRRGVGLRCTRESSHGITVPEATYPYVDTQ
jgi:hypothetical protein